MGTHFSSRLIVSCGLLHSFAFRHSFYHHLDRTYNRTVLSPHSLVLHKPIVNMRFTSTIAAGALVAGAVAQGQNYLGFNSGANKADRSAKFKADFKAEFETAANLNGAPGTFTSVSGLPAPTTSTRRSAPCRRPLTSTARSLPTLLLVSPLVVRISTVSPPPVSRTSPASVTLPTPLSASSTTGGRPSRAALW